jgi:hypothetical protein
MRKFTIAALAVALSLVGCAGISQSSWTKDVGLAESSFLAAELVINPAVQAKAPQAFAAVTKAETDVSAELSVLANSSAPVNATALVTDLQNLESAIPPNVLSKEDQDIVSGVLSLAQVLVTDFSQTQAVIRSVEIGHLAAR